jgi:hypothetical protein
MQFESVEKAREYKSKLVNINNDHKDGHFINEKRVDVKSADDYIKPQPGQLPTGNLNQMTGFNMHQ